MLKRRFGMCVMIKFCKRRFASRYHAWHRLRKNELAGSTIKLKLRWPDFTTLTRQTTIGHRTDQEDEIAKTALELLNNVRKPNQAVRLIGVGVSGLGQPIRQLGLWDMDSE